MAFADKLKALRLEKGYTQKELAKLIHVAQPTYCNYEKGKIYPHVNTQIQLANVLGVDRQELMSE